MWTGRIESWRVQATAFIMRIKSRFTCCMANKTSKVTQYGIQMDQRIAAMRARLTQRLESVSIFKSTTALTVKNTQLRLNLYSAKL